MSRDRKLQISHDTQSLVLAQLALRTLYTGQKSQSTTDVTLDCSSVLGHENKRSVLIEQGTLLTYPPFMFPANTLLY